MTQLTDKMEGLRLKQGEAVPFQAIHFNEALDKCIALVKAEEVENNLCTCKNLAPASIHFKDCPLIAEEAVVGDWETTYRTTRRNACVPTTTYKEWLDNEVTFIASLLAAKDGEIAEAYKKGFIDGGLSK